MRGCKIWLFKQDGCSVPNLLLIWHFVGMSMTPEQGHDYLTQNNIPQLFESIMIGLVHERPEDPLKYISSCIATVNVLGGISNVQWDSFVSNVLLNANATDSSIFKTETPHDMINQDNLISSSSPANKDDKAQPTCKANSSDRGSLSEASTSQEEAMADALKSKTIVFVVGGPGSGKGTQCDLIKERYGFTHFSSGDLLRAEVASGSEKGKELSAIMERGELVPLSTVLELIKKNMIEHAKTSKGFLIDGYPREVQQGIEFENTIAPCSFVLWIDSSQDTMVKRLLIRAETSGRADDNEETIRKRLQTFVESTEPVITYYEKQNKVKRINAEQTVNDVFNDVQAVFDVL